MGPKPYQKLPFYLKIFDVATIPFKINNITLSTSPIKMFEYFAGGKPVVTTPMPECMKYSPPVLIGETKEDYLKKLKQALKLKDKPSYIKQITELARQHTWQKRAEQIIKQLEKSLS